MEIGIKGWNSNELEFVVKNYSNMTINDIAKELNKKPKTVTYAAKKLKLKKQNHSKWTEEEFQYLREHTMDTSEEIAKVLKKTVNAVNGKRTVLGLYKSQPWTEEEIQYLKQNYESELYSDIAKLFNRSEGAIRAKCHELNLVQKDEWTNDDLEFLRKNYYEYTNAELAKLLNRTENAIHLKGNRMGLKKSPYYCNYGFFDDINTEEKAYWLGFLTADGWINKNEKTNAGVVGTEIQYGDIEHLKKFNKSLEGNYKITDRWKECSITSKDKTKKNHMCCLRIFSQQMYNSLVKLGFTNNKSYDVDIPDISNELLPHYLRGYFDGDGCFSYTSKSFGVSFLSASWDLIHSLHELFKKKLDIECNVSSYVSEYETTMYTIQIYKKKDKIKLLDYMYQEASIYLNRKYEKYLRVKAELKNYERPIC